MDWRLVVHCLNTYGNVYEENNLGHYENDRNYAMMIAKNGQRTKEIIIYD